jgi:hypothetical protein
VNIIAISLCRDGRDVGGRREIRKRRWVQRMGDFTCRERGDVNRTFRNCNSVSGEMWFVRIKRFLRLEWSNVGVPVIYCCLVFRIEEDHDFC